MLFWFKLFIINILLHSAFATSFNPSIEHLSPIELVERGMSGRRHIDIDNWLTEAQSYNTNEIHSVHEIYDYLKVLSNCPFGHVTLQNLTVKRVRARLDAITEMGNYIPFLNISIGSYVQKPAIVVIGGIMGCHWLTVAASVNLAKQLAVFYDQNYEHTSSVTWIIIPVLNPDGYNLTLSDKNMRDWKKNLGKPKVNPTHRRLKNCFGVDLCMNFEYQWISSNYINSSWCDDNYADIPFSQNESRAVKDTVADHLDTIRMFVQLKQNRRLLMYPFRYTSLLPIFSKFYDNIVKSAAEAASASYNRPFGYGHVIKYNKKTAGELDDWVMAHLGISLGFTYEIAKWRTNNVTPSRKEIEATNSETFEALKVIAEIGSKYDDIGFLAQGIKSASSVIHILNIFSIILLLILMFLLE